MRVTSKAFKTGQQIPTKYTYEGENVSPPLRVTGVPKNAEYFRIKCLDPDAPSENPWVHWNIIVSASLINIPENLDSSKVLQSFPNSWGNETYEGPKPPRGEEHSYFYIVKAYDKKKKMLAKAKLIGKYRRERGPGNKHPALRGN